MQKMHISIIKSSILITVRLITIIIIIFLQSIYEHLSFFYTHFLRKLTSTVNYCLCNSWRHSSFKSLVITFANDIVNSFEVEANCNNRLILICRFIHVRSDIARPCINVIIAYEVDLVKGEYFAMHHNLNLIKKNNRKISKNGWKWMAVFWLCKIERENGWWRNINRPTALLFIKHIFLVRVSDKLNV